MRPRKLLPPTALAIAAALTLSGCFASSGSDSDSDSASSQGDRDGKRIRVAMMQPPRSGLSPLSDDAFKLSRWSTAETLVTLDREGDAQPALATKWTRTNDKTWTFTLRTGVTFHDGTPLTATDVERSLTRAATAAPKPRILDGVELTVEAKDGAVTVTTGEPDPLVPQRLSSPQLSILAAKAYRGKTVNPVGTGTGAFVLKKAGGTSSATLDRNEDYWGGRAKAAGIDATYVPDGAARAAALRSGTADIVEAVPVSQASLLDKDQITEVPMPRTNTLYLNTESGVFKDAGQRAAARSAIDTKALVEGIYEGRADAADGLLGPALPWAAERAGRTKAAKAAKPSGKTITIGTFTDRAELPEVAAALQQQLKDAGFKVKLDIREYANIESDALDGKFDAFILSRATILDSGDPAAYLHSDFMSDGSFNIAQLADPAVDKAVREAESTQVGDARRTAILDAETAILNTDGAIPMLHERVIQGDATHVVGSVKDPRERELITVGTYVK
ncbi:ABC transporter substrate-binding protein [Streptomyces apocyni]|uniref:ABC transporter substrate-binding protein n=1 Tax=Streptomyces apocyni TaxID=2654677 RepID=UPI0012E9E26D|nr:ABC transporter substrate-binding protein [Streptomyces apocyni]